jgi:hypothetical protein
MSIPPPWRVDTKVSFGVSFLRGWGEWLWQEAVTADRVRGRV